MEEQRVKQTRKKTLLFMTDTPSRMDWISKTGGGLSYEIIGEKQEIRRTFRRLVESQVVLRKVFRFRSSGEPSEGHENKRTFGRSGLSVFFLAASKHASYIERQL